MILISFIGCNVKPIIVLSSSSPSGDAVVVIEDAVSGVERHGPDPPLMEQLLKQRMPINNRLDAMPRSLDHRQQAHRVMIRRASVEDRLGGQPDAQVAPC